MKPPLSASTDRVRRHPLFAQNPALWEVLAPHIHAHSYTKDTAILHHGDAAQALWLVLSGWVKLVRQTPDGKETIVGLCTEGDVFGEASLFKHAAYPYHALAIGDTAELASIPSSRLRELVGQYSELAADVMLMLNQHMAQAQLKLEHMNTLSAAQRLGCFLLRLCHAQADGQTQLQIPVEKHVLAAFLGMKPETLSRSQQQLKPVGVEVRGHTIRLADIGRLRDFVCNSCSESGSCKVEAALCDE